MSESSSIMSPQVRGPSAGAPLADEPAPKTVLVVDDYRTLGEMLGTVLRSAGYAVLIASSGEEAAELIKDRSAIDLLLTDLEMPHMRGDELGIWVRCLWPGTPVLLMSSKYPRPGSIPEFQFLQKPFSPPVLLRAVREIFHNSARTLPTSGQPLES